MDRFAFGFLIALLIATPWPLGSRLPWASMLAAALVIAVGTAWLAAKLLGVRRFAYTPLFLPIVAFLALAGTQWALGWTIYPHATAYEWVRYLSYATVFALALQLCEVPERAYRLASVVAAMAVAVGMFGLLQFLTWNGQLFWIYEPPYEGTRFGPFNNRNYFAGYILAAVGPAMGRIFAGGGSREGRAFWTYFSWIAVVSLLVSLSRGAIVAFLAMIAALAALVPRGGPPKTGARSRWRWLREGAGAKLSLVAIVLVVLFAGLLWVDQVDRVLARLETVLRFESEASFQGRAAIWRDALAMVAERPLTGYGLNTFGWAFPRYRREPVSSVAMHAHNEYLEVLVESGILGAAFCLWFVALLFREGWRRLRDCRARERGLRLGALAGWSGILVYSITDFPTIIPAIDYVLAVLAALAVVEWRNADHRTP